MHYQPPRKSDSRLSTLLRARWTVLWNWIRWHLKEAIHSDAMNWCLFGPRQLLVNNSLEKKINLNLAEVQRSDTSLFSHEAQPVKSQIQHNTQPELKRLVYIHFGTSHAPFLLLFCFGAEGVCVWRGVCGGVCVWWWWWWWGGLFLLSSLNQVVYDIF